MADLSLGLNVDSVHVSEQNPKPENLKPNSAIVNIMDTARAILMSDMAFYIGILLWAH